jgi:hypothetical protein
VFEFPVEGTTVDAIEGPLSPLHRVAKTQLCYALGLPRLREESTNERKSV